MFKRNILSMIGLAALMSSAALATTDVTANLGATATVVNTCIVQGATVAFGTVATIASTSNTDGPSTISVACTTGMTAPTIKLGQGLHPGGSSSDAAPIRNMKASGALLMSYHLSSASAGGTEWDNNTGVQFSGAIDGTYETMAVYGQVPGGQTTLPASTGYADTVLITVTF